MKRLLPILAIVLLALPYRQALSTPVSERADLVEGAKGRVVLNGGPPDHARVRREIEQILALPEYNRTHTESTLEKLQARAGKWLRDVVVSTLNWIADRLSFRDLRGAGLLATVGTWAVVIMFVVLLGMIASRYIRRAAGSAGSRDDEEHADYDLPSPGPLVKEAAKLAEAGDYRGAFRATYLACIAHLDSIRALRFERSRTNWEYLHELKRGGHEKSCSELHPLTVDFDRKIYGQEPCSRQDYLNAAAVYQRLSSEEAK